MTRSSLVISICKTIRYALFGYLKLDKGEVTSQVTEWLSLDKVGIGFWKLLTNGSQFAENYGDRCAATILLFFRNKIGSVWTKKMPSKRAFFAFQRSGRERLGLPECHIYQHFAILFFTGNRISNRIFRVKHE